MNSIRLDLLKWLIAPLLVINLVGALLVYMLAWSPAQAAMDQNLAEMAFDLRMHLHVGNNSVEMELPLQAERILRSNAADLTFFVVRAGQRTLAGDKDFPPLLVPGKEDLPFPYSGKLRNTPVRFLVLKTMVGSEQVMIGVAETLAKRREIQSNILLTMFGLEAVLVVTSVAIAWFAVTEGLFPLQQMQVELDTRAPNDLSAVEDDQPLELRPLAKAINGLLQRLEHDGKSRQTFLANVAHQLRTPLAGLQTQLTLLQDKHAADKDTAHALGLMMSAAERMTRQTNQLLVLARAEPTQIEMRRMEALSLDKLVEQVIDQFVQAALRKNIDIGFDLQPAPMVGDHFLLRDLIDNLVDNALRYTPAGGAVTVRCGARDKTAVFEVEDNGPGIPVADRGKIFSRFYRLDTKLPGTGLGLAIVGDIAKAHDATVTLDSGPGGVGTLFSVSFPLPG
jgi:two-component system sensor histidine kinase TctE